MQELPEPGEDLVGTSFGPYRIEEKLGQGGMGVVYKALDVNLQRPVALKMIKGDKASATEGGQARFMREARAASRLQHPSIVTIYHFGVEGDTEYIVMEFIEGKSLRKLIRDEPMPLHELYLIAIQTAEGLAAAHDANVVHRDLKGDNIMVTSRGQVKILDFGLAKLKDPVEEESDDTATAFQTQAGLAVGTATHMSPEQAMGREVDGKSDVFSFGVVLYHMATGKVPFTGPNAAITMARILDANPTPVREINPLVPEGLADLITRCLQKNRAQRPAAHEITKALRALRDVHNRVPVVAAMAAAAAAPSSGGASSPTPAASVPTSVPVVMAGWQTPQPAQALTPLSGIPSAAIRQSSQSTQLLPAKPGIFYWPVAALHAATNWATLGVLLLLALYFVAGGLPLFGHDLERFKLYTLARSLVAPAVAYVHKVTEQKEMTRAWDLTLPGLGVLALALRGIVLWPVRRLERALRRAK